MTCSTVYVCRLSNLHKEILDMISRFEDILTVICWLLQSLSQTCNPLEITTSAILTITPPVKFACRNVHEDPRGFSEKTLLKIFFLVQV